MSSRHRGRLASTCEQLESLARPERGGSVDGSNATAMRVLGATVPDLRGLVRELDGQLEGTGPEERLALAEGLIAAGSLEARQVAYELLGRCPALLRTLGIRQIEALGRGNDNWKSVDVFALEITGFCWREGRLSDAAVGRWAARADVWWQRTALVSTVPLNLRARGGTGDTPRTLAICRALAASRADPVVKALSWALRSLARWDPTAVGAFLSAPPAPLAARVTREVWRLLETGRKG